MTLPRLPPIIPTRRKEPFDHPEWLFDFKYDGFRALCYIEQGRCRFISRNGNVLSRFEALGNYVAATLHVDDAIIDGKVIAADQTGRPQFYELLRGTRSASYVLLISSGSNGADLRSLPLSERRRRHRALRLLAEGWDMGIKGKLVLYGDHVRLYCRLGQFRGFDLRLRIAGKPFAQHSFFRGREDQSRISSQTQRVFTKSACCFLPVVARILEIS